MMPSRHRALPLLSLTAVTILGGCSTRSSGPDAATSNLNHVVLISLKNEADAEACAADCRAMLGSIDCVDTLWVGTPVDTGRSMVDDDYEVGLCVGFERLEDLQTYLDAPAHVDLVESWGPRATRFRIFDVGQPRLDR